MTDKNDRLKSEGKLPLAAHMKEVKEGSERERERSGGGRQSSGGK